MSYSPHRRRKVEDDVSQGFCAALQRSPPPVPPALLRRIGGKEVTGVGKQYDTTNRYSKSVLNQASHRSYLGVQVAELSKTLDFGSELVQILSVTEALFISTIDCTVSTLLLVLFDKILAQAGG
ncbi:hypothetical protein J6590_077596 [Homalodisca vitripennis]|nr:hypothetical protein J6590_077596 [Homalodisca vitripennis]